MQNSFEILGVPETATLEEIKSAYKVLAKKYHTDVSGNSSSERMAEINAAYDTLKTPQKLQAYRQHLGAQRQGFSGFSHHSRNPFETQDPLHDIFQDIFGMWGNGPRPQPRADLTFNLQISLREAYMGRNDVVIRYQNPDMKELKFNIPPLTNTGDRMVFSRKGRVIGNQVGDLVIQFTVLPDNDTGYQVANAQGDLLYNLQISYLDAIVGIDTTIDFISGEKLSVKVPGVVMNQQIVVIPFKGLRNSAQNRISDLLVRILVTHDGISAQDVEKVRSALRSKH